ncbi:solute carrier family 12 member 2-like protein [Leptotrombidium deliense]|uniref:Solute carrier family 12 member 2-like protein n=1 Tax=Leptotrombidium deliense TaxID=299467 RepID=A0A443SST6_9ACAR|nr:solute carrier family 12 member 2-like protein [Leptotrombidium deliense]
MDADNEQNEEKKPFLNKSNDSATNAKITVLPRKSSLVVGNNRSRFQVAKVDFANIPEASISETGDDKSSGAGTQSPSHHSIDYSTYDTHNVRSLRHYTREPLPRASHYRDVRSIHRHLDRPTLDDLLHNRYNASDDKYKYRVSRALTSM